MGKPVPNTFSSLDSASHDLDEYQKGEYHCVLCLVSLSADKVKKCGKCHVRAYCGRVCQAEDWSSKGRGQGHKNWCGLPYGEEDVDWKIVLVEGKGRGIIALRKFSAGSRIMVDGFRVKKQTGAVYPDSALHGSGLVNHACNPNAGVIPMYDVGVQVIYAEREIEVGEEICKTYTFFNIPIRGPKKTIQESRAHILSKYNIVCPGDCFCSKEGLDMEIERCRKLNESIRHGMSIKSVNEANLALKDVKVLLTLREVVKFSLVEKVGIWLSGFRIAVQQKKTLPLALKYLSEAYSFMCEVGHPLMQEARDTEKYVKDLRSAPWYLMLEK